MPVRCWPMRQWMSTGCVLLVAHQVEELFDLIGRWRVSVVAG